MKESLHRIFSITMALLLLVSTTSWTVGKHYCMDRLIDVSFFEHAEDCCMDQPMGGNGVVNAIEDRVATAFQDEADCCKNEIISYAGQDDLRVSFNDLGFDQQVFLAAFTYSHLTTFQITAERPATNEHYPPPRLVKNIQLLDQVFII